MTQNSTNNAAYHAPPDVYPCITCQKHCETGIRCSDCNMWTHYACTQLSIYILSIYTCTNRKFTCMSCAQNYNNYKATEEEIRKSIESELAQGVTEKVVAQNNDAQSQEQIAAVANMQEGDVGDTPPNLDVSVLLGTPQTSVSEQTQIQTWFQGRTPEENSRQDQTNSTQAQPPAARNKQNRRNDQANPTRAQSAAARYQVRGTICRYFM